MLGDSDWATLARASPLPVESAAASERRSTRSRFGGTPLTTATSDALLCVVCAYETCGDVAFARTAGTETATTPYYRTMTSVRDFWYSYSNNVNERDPYIVGYSCIFNHANY